MDAGTQVPTFVGLPCRTFLKPREYYTKCQSPCSLGILEVSPNWLLNGGTKPRAQLKLELQLLAAEGITAVPLLMPTLLLEHNTDQQRAQYVAAALLQHGVYGNV